jgi:hypothetical protein
LIAEIAVALPPAVGSFLLTSRQDAGAIIAQQRRCRVNTVQLCDCLQPGTYAGSPQPPHLPAAPTDPTTTQKVLPMSPAKTVTCVPGRSGGGPQRLPRRGS